MLWPVQLGPYQLAGEVGRGGCGTVYRGRSPDGRDVAIKLLTSANPAAAARFERERALLAELGEAEGFVPLIGAGEVPEGAYLVMPFVPGGTLRERLRGEPMPIDDVVRLARTLAETLGRAHARGIIHRDLKPENILFTAAGSPLVADLGLAKRLAGTKAEGLSLSMTGEFRGTAGYMAPEQMRDSKAAGPTADVFSLGAIIYECLAGAPLFVAENVMDVIDLTSSGHYTPLESHRSDVPKWLRAVVRRCLAGDPEKRFADGVELRAALGGDATASTGRAVTSLAIGALGVALGLAIGVVVGRSTAPVPVTVTPPPVDVASTTVSAPPENTTTPTTTTVTPTTPTTVSEAPVEPVATVPIAETLLGRELGGSKHFAVDALLGDPWSKHTGGIVAISVESGAVIAGDGHGVVRVWRDDRAPRAAVVTGNKRLIKRIATGASAHAEIGIDDRVFFRALGKASSLLVHHTGAVHAVAMTGDSRFVVTGGEDLSVVVWNVERREKPLVAMHDSPTTAVAISEDGESVLCGTKAGAVALWSVAARRQIMKVGVSGGGAARFVALTPDRARGAVALESGGVVVIDLATNAGLPQVKLEGAPLALGFASDGARLIGVDALGVSVWALPGMERVARHDFPEDVFAAGVARDGTRVAFSFARGSVLRTLDVATGALSAPPSGHRGWIAKLAVSGDRVWSASIDHTLRRWDASGRDEVLCQSESALSSLSVAPDGTVVAVGEKTAFAEGPSAPARSIGAEPTIADVLFAGGRWWIGRVDGMVESTPAAGTAGGRNIIVGHRRVIGFAPLPERGVASWALEGQDAVVRANEAGFKTQAVTTKPGRRCALAALPGTKATIVLGDSGGTLRWLDLEQGRELRAMKAHQDEVLCLALSPDGRLGVSGGFDRTLRVWDAQSGAELEVIDLGGSADVPTAVAFTRDGRGLVVGFGSGTIARLSAR